MDTWLSYDKCTTFMRMPRENYSTNSHLVEHLCVGRSFLQVDSQRVLAQSLPDKGQLAVVTFEEVVNAGRNRMHIVSFQDFGQQDRTDVLRRDVRIISCELQHPSVVALVVFVI